MEQKTIYFACNAFTTDEYNPVTFALVKFTEGDLNVISRIREAVESLTSTIGIVSICKNYIGTQHYYQTEPEDFDTANGPVQITKEEYDAYRTEFEPEYYSTDCGHGEISGADFYLKSYGKYCGTHFEVGSFNAAELNQMMSEVSNG